jgi:hypothetical protein
MRLCRLSYDHRYGSCFLSGQRIDLLDLWQKHDPFLHWRLHFDRGNL